MELEDTKTTQQTQTKSSIPNRNLHLILICYIVHTYVYSTCSTLVCSKEGCCASWVPEDSTRA